MKNRLLMPRIHRAAAQLIWSDRQNMSVAELTSVAATSHELAAFAATGGSKVPESELLLMGKKIRGRAEQEGFPEKPAAFRRFDVLTAVILADEWPGTLGEALLPDVWNFLSTVLLPDVVAWRWQARSPDRLYGSLYRNALGRLWLHGMLLDRHEGTDANDRWHLLIRATEDFLMNLVERPTLSADPRFARLIAEEWVRWRERPMPSTELEPLHRSALKMLRLVSTTLETAVLDDAQLQAVISEAFSRSAEVLQQRH